MINQIGILPTSRGGTGSATLTDGVSYTPVLGGTGVTLGDGTITGFYTQVGKRVSMSVNITYGATTSFGTGLLSVSLPVNTTNTANISGLSCYGLDAGSKYWMFTTESNGLGSVILYNEAGAFINATTPFTWAAGDILRLNVTYNI